MKPKLTLDQENSDPKKQAADRRDELVINDGILEAIREKLFVDAANTPYGQLEDFDLNSLRGLSLNQALISYPKLLEIMDDVLVKVSTAISGVLHDKTVQSDVMEDCDAFARLLKKCGKWFCQYGHFNQALKAFEGALKFLPDDGEIYTMIADVYFVTENFLEAAEYYDKALTFMPGDEKILRRLAHIHIEIAEHFLDSDLATAYEFYERARDYMPNYAPALCGMGGVDFLNRNYKGALHNYKKALKADPTCVQAITGLANVYLELDDDEKAESLYEEATVKIPLFFPALLSMAKFQFYYRGNMKRALHYLHDALTAEPYNIEALMMMASLSMDTKDYKIAEESLEKVLMIEPNNRDAFEMYCRLKNGDDFFPPKHGVPKFAKAVSPERQSQSRDYHFSLDYYVQPGPDSLKTYVTYVADEQRDRFSMFKSRYGGSSLN